MGYIFFHKSIIITERMVTVWINLLKAFSGNSFTKWIPKKAPVPITGNMSRFSVNPYHNNQG